MEAAKILSRDQVAFASAGSVAARPVLRAGVKYEAKVHDVLQAAWKELGSYLAGPWIEYVVGNKKLVCQPDAILTFKSGAVLIVEVKLTHTQNAWWQLRKLYEPVVRALTNHAHPIYLLEVCKSCDPMMSFPEKIKLHTDARDVKQFWNNEFNVVLVKGK